MRTETWVKWVGDAVPEGEGLLKESSGRELMFKEGFLLVRCFVSVLSTHHPHNEARELLLPFFIQG